MNEWINKWHIQRTMYKQKCYISITSYNYVELSHKLRKLLYFPFTLTMNKEGTKKVKKLNEGCTASKKKKSSFKFKFNTIP